MIQFALKIGRPLAISAFVILFATSALSQVDFETQALARSTIASIESSLERETERFHRFREFSYLPSAALAAGDTELAAKYAKELLTKADGVSHIGTFETSKVNEAIHISNTVLGLVEFDKGDIARARDHLLASARLEGLTPPVLASFGPTMLLAKKLLEKGETETVIEYFDLCARFWLFGDERLEIWKATAANGKMPDFGPSLHTGLYTWKYRN